MFSCIIFIYNIRIGVIDIQVRGQMITGNATSGTAVPICSNSSERSKAFPANPVLTVHHCHTNLRKRMAVNRRLRLLVFEMNTSWIPVSARCKTRMTSISLTSRVADCTVSCPVSPRVGVAPRKLSVVADVVTEYRIQPSLYAPIIHADGQALREQSGVCCHCS